MSDAYEPRVGDTVEMVRLTKPQVITKVTSHYVWLNNEPSGHARDVVAFKLVEAAPVPFEVGKPLTEEMGEPPVGSIILESPTVYDGLAWQRQDDGLWYVAAAAKRQVRSGLAWDSVNFDLPNNTLIHLGESK